MSGREKPKGELGREVIARLEGFNASLRAGEDVCAKFTTRKVHINLEPTPYNPELVKKTRRLLQMSQSLFARFLGVSKKTIQAWEQGVTPPNAMACRFMDEIQHDPPRWRERFRGLIRSTDATHAS